MEIIDVRRHFLRFHASRTCYGVFLAADVTFVLHRDFHFLFRVRREIRAAERLFHRLVADFRPFQKRRGADTRRKRRRPQFLQSGVRVRRRGKSRPLDVIHRRVKPFLPRQETGVAVFAHEADFMSLFRQAKVRIVLAKEQAVLAAARHHAIRLVRAFRDQIVDERPDVRFVAAEDEGLAALDFERRIDARHEPLRRCLLVARCAV